MSDSARFVIEVTAGIIPGGDPEPEFTRRWALNSTIWHAADTKKQSEILAELNGQAQGYAALLMLQPERLNWVRTDWVWL